MDNPKVTTAEEPTPEPEPLPSSMAAVEIAAAAMDDEAQQRAWIDSIVPILKLKIAHQVHEENCRTALDRLIMTAADRATRILRADLTRGH